MCSPSKVNKAVQTTARVVSGVATLGASELGRNPMLQKVADTAARAVSGVATLGASEVARNNLPASSLVNQTLQLPGNIVTGGKPLQSELVNKVLQIPGRIVTGSGAIQKAASAFGLVKPEEALAPESPTPTPAEPTPTFTPPTPSETSAMLRRRRLNALRMGIASTIRTSGRGTPGFATLLTPAAGGSTTGKTLLGV